MKGMNHAAAGHRVGKWGGSEKVEHQTGRTALQFGGS